MAVSQKQRELAASYIGHWAGRMKAGKPTTELHLIESAINDTAETRCGKHMRAQPLKNSTGMAIEVYFPDGTEHCKVCTAKSAPGAVSSPADETPDASTPNALGEIPNETPFPPPGATTGLAGQPK